MRASTVRSIFDLRKADLKAQEEQRRDAHRAYLEEDPCYSNERLELECDVITAVRNTYGSGRPNAVLRVSGSSDNVLDAALGAICEAAQTGLGEPRASILVGQECETPNSSEVYRRSIYAAQLGFADRLQGMLAQLGYHVTMSVAALDPEKYKRLVGCTIELNVRF